jgi:hypothetical protein
MRLVIAALCGLLLSIGPASAAGLVNSSYTDLDLDQCTVITSDDFGSTWACPGLKGIPVMVGEGDLRFFVSYGLTSTTEKAAEQTLPPFNHLGAKIEWRVSNDEGRWLPFATILRYFTAKPDGSEGEGQVLVVTKVAPGATCHVAYIDALANADANGLAQKTADEKARDFDCAKDTAETVGAFTAW